MVFGKLFAIASEGKWIKQNTNFFIAFVLLQLPILQVYDVVLRSRGDDFGF